MKLRVGQNGAPTFKDEQRHEIDDSGIEVLVQIAKKWFEGCDGQEVCGAIPRDVVQRSELSRSARDGNPDDILIEAQEKNAQAQGADDYG